MKPYLKDIPSSLHHLAYEALNERDSLGFLCRASNELGLWIVWNNLQLLQSLGMYEESLLIAVTATRTNNHYFPLYILKYLFEEGDRQRFRDAGDPLVGPGPYTLYRGVGGSGPARRVRGLSWTSSLDQAQWFAARAFDYDLNDPAVYQVQVHESSVWAFWDERKEEEFIIDIPKQMNPIRRQEPFLHKFPEFSNTTSS